MAVNTYYFDGLYGISDFDSAWTDDSYAFDGNINNYASTTILNKMLSGTGTTAPHTGISDTDTVEARAYVHALGLDGYIDIVDYTNLNTLGTINIVSGTVGWTSTVTLSQPTNGWSTDGLVESLIAAINSGAAGSPSSELGVSRVEIIVTSGETIPTIPTIQNIQSITGISTITL